MNATATRRQFLVCGSIACMGLVSAFSSSSSVAQLSKPLVEVWKSPTCGCCKDWIAYLELNGFRVKAYDQGNNAKRAELGFPKQFASCHTATVQGYVLEGHVPVREIHRLLKEQPKALGLSVPEMPIGTPGMDGPEYGGQKDPYNVLLIGHSGNAKVFASYPEKRVGRL